MTRRFDRLATGEKLHMQSLCALAHFDFNQAGAYAYEQALLVIRQLQLPMQAIEQLFRRMAFNIVARNQDDHVKNIAFLMNKSGEWSLAPAFDVTYSFNPAGAWNGKPSDDDEWKTRQFHAGGLQRLRQDCVDETGARRENPCRGAGDGIEMGVVCRNGRRA